MHPIKMTNEMLAKMNKQIMDALKTYKFDKDTKTIPVNIKEMFNKKTKKPTIRFSTIAWTKTQHLIQQCDTEVGWQGLVKRENDYSFVIQDVILYPQTVTAATVNTDDTEIAKWYDTLDDNTLNALRMHGHSHVNMPTSPSSTDLSMYQGYLDLLKNNDFFIFMIFNKRSDITVILYDLKTNMKYYTEDINLVYADTNMSKWYDEQVKKNISKQTYTQTRPNNIWINGKPADDTIDKRISSWENTFSRRSY